MSEARHRVSGCCPPTTVTVDKWINVTKVGRLDLVADVPVRTDTHDPFSRHNSGYYNGVIGSPACADELAGVCGTWLLNGDANGLSQQEIDGLANDILACAATDATHSTKDHNCYQKSGTKDLTRTKHGGFWVQARKSWHGMAGVIDANDPQPITDMTPFDAGSVFTHNGFGTTIQEFRTSAPQTRYRTAQIVGSSHWELTHSSGSPHYSYDSAFDVTSTVGKYTGIITNTGSYTIDSGYNPENPGTVAFSVVAGASLNGFAAMFFGFTITDFTAYPNAYFTGSGTTFQIHHGDDIPSGGFVPDYVMEEVEFNPAGGVFARRKWAYDPGIAAPSLIYEETCSFTNTTVTYTIRNVQTILFLDQYDYYGEATLTLSDAYTASELYADIQSLLNAWDMGDWRLSALRADTQLQNAPLCVYDELSPTQPAPSLTITMDDLDDPLTDDNGVAPFHTTDSGAVLPWVYDSGIAAPWAGKYGQIGWLDPNSYWWKFPSGSTRTTGANAIVSGAAYGGAELITGMRTGEIISHTGVGSDRHFWFAAQNYLRTYVGGTPNYRWDLESTGNSSADPLPECTMRWLDKNAAQYDSDASLTDPPPALFPQMFYRHQDGLLLAAKYVEACDRWPSINFARPCGPDKFAVDQTTVCCVLSTGSGTFTVKKTRNAIEPTDSGGLAVSQFIIVGGDGLYQISSIDDDGMQTDGTNNWHQWTIHVGAMVDTLPTGDTMPADYLGRARWITAPGICGRAAITTTEAAGVVTIAAADALPYLRTGASVDVCNSAMSVLATVTVTRTDDQHWTCTHAALPTAAWLVPHLLYDGVTPGTKYYFSDSTPRNTFVLMQWYFNKRMAAAADDLAAKIAASDADPGDPIKAAATSLASGNYATAFGSYPPTWYDDLPGCLSIDLAQSTFSQVVCYPPIIGCVPTVSGAPVDSFTNYSLATFPSFTADDVFGGFAQYVVEPTMPDPFWQEPFVQDCDFEEFEWIEDDGTGQEDALDGTVKYYAHRPLVEACNSYPTIHGEVAPTLPSGINFTYDTSINVIPPPYYPHGIPVGDASGNFASVYRSYRFRMNACAATRFASDYAAFVDCSP